MAATSTTLRITEVFLSIQGEADAVGWPSVFVRLTGCPLRCVWCDTSYAFQGGDKRTLTEVLDQVASYGVRHVCVTGGEPLAQRGCVELLRTLCDAGYRVSLETSGALDVSAIDTRVRKVLDLKCPGSGEQARNRYENLEHLQPHDQIKFVIADRADYEWARMQAQQHSLSSRCQVLFSPVADSMSPTLLAEWILEDRLPVRFQMQLHKLLWGNVAGR